MRQAKRKKPTAKRRTAKRRRSSAIVKAQPQVTIVQGNRIRELRHDEIELLKRTVARGCTEDEFALFLWVCRKHRVDPLTRQIYPVKRWLSKHHKEKRLTEAGGEIEVWVGGEQMTIQMGIDGYRALAARGHRDFGGCDDAEFVMYQPERKTPAGRTIPERATIRMWKRGLDHPVTATAFWEEFAPADLNEAKADFYNRMPKHMLAKCAESLAIRKGYPDMADIYTDEEMTQHSQDFTLGGRQIVDQNGIAPSGRAVTYEAQHEIGREAAKRVLDEKLAHGHEPGTARAQQAEAQLAKVQQADQEALKTKEAAQERPIDVVPGMTGALPRLQVETVGPDDFIVRGDIQALFPMIEKYCQWKPDHWWHAELANLQAMQGLQAKLKFQITGSPSQSSGAAKRPGRPAAEGGDTASTKAGASAAGPKLINGTILKSIAGMAGQTPVRDVTILLANKTRPSYRTFDKTLFSPLDAGVGKEAEIIIKASGKYTNLVGLKKIGATEYEEDGRTPHALQQKDREAGGQTLF
jgi:phage recombination protein Bet